MTRLGATSHSAQEAAASRLRGASRQRGVSLVTALLFMVATLLLGVSVMGVNAMQERIIGNTRDHDLALQAAEAALRDAEADIVANIGPASAFDAVCTRGLCTPPSQRVPASTLPVEQQAAFSWGSARIYGEFTRAAAFPSVNAQPVYVIEKLGPLGAAPGESAALGAPAGVVGTGYRITARAVGVRPETVVVLQAVYAKR